MSSSVSNLTMNSSRPSKETRVSREYYISEVSKTFEKLNSTLSNLSELHGSLLLNNVNVVKYIKQLQSHLEDEKSECESSSEQ